MIKVQGVLGFVLMVTFLLCATATAGILSGRIIKENGTSLAKTKIAVEGKGVVTNEFGGYEVELKDGERELNVVIDNVPYTSERIFMNSLHSSLCLSNLNLVERQGAMLSQIKEGMVYQKILYPGRDGGIIVPPEDEKAYRNHRLGITVTGIEANDDYRQDSRGGYSRRKSQCREHCQGRL